MLSIHSKFSSRRGLLNAYRTAASVASSCDVVVIGGGIVGCSAARALAKRGASVVLLEQNTLTSGTTWHAAGNMHSMKASTAVYSLAKYGAELYRQMNDESGNSLVGWANTGALGISRSLDDMEGLVRSYQTARAMGDKSQRIVTPGEIQKIHPFLNPDGIVGGLYSPDDGMVNPGDVTQWIAKDARAHGAIIRERTEVVGIRFDKGLRRVVSVRTEHGEEISCGSAILCGGAWTKKLSKLMYGKNMVPVAMMPHQYVIFEKAAGVGNHLPIVRDMEHKYYMKPEVGGFCVGIFEGDSIQFLPDIVRQRNSNAIPMERTAEHEVYEEDYEKAGRWLEAAMEHVPILGEVGVKQILHGPDTHSSDHHPLIGRLPAADNAYIATGFNSQGIQCAPGAGLSLAETILDGAPHTIGDLSETEPSRVFPDLCEDAEWVEMRACEGYSKMFGVHFPGEIFESARSRRHSPVHKDQLQAGAVFGETYGWERALYFPRPQERRTPKEQSLWFDSSVPSPSPCAFSYSRSEAEYFKAEQRECKATREAAALFDLSSFGKILVSGPQALAVLQRCMTAELDKKVGTATYSLFCDPRGGIQGDLAVTRLASQEFYVTTIAVQPGKVLDQLHKVAAEMDANGCQVEDITESRGILALNGPKSRTILSKLCPDALDNESFPPYSCRSITVTGVEVLALRVSFAGELGWELHVQAGDASKLYKALLEAGSEHGITPAGVMSLLNSLRVEKGFVHYGGEIAPDVTPLESALAFACKLKPEQADFVGKEAIVEQRKAGWTKRLVSVKARPEDNVTLWGHCQELLYRNGELVGSLTSGAHSHTLGCAIGQGFIKGPPKVPAKWLAQGSYEVEVPVRLDGNVSLQRFPVEISTRCLVDPEGVRLLGSD